MPRERKGLGFRVWGLGFRLWALGIVTRYLSNAQRAKGLLKRTGSEASANADPIGWCLIWRAAI
jgi:hypothetical protein